METKGHHSDQRVPMTLAEVGHELSVRKAEFHNPTTTPQRVSVLTEEIWALEERKIQLLEQNGRREKEDRVFNILKETADEEGWFTTEATLRSLARKITLGIR